MKKQSLLKARGQIDMDSDLFTLGTAKPYSMPQL